MNISYAKTKQNMYSQENENDNGTRCSQAVTHPSTNRARCCLTSVIGRELVFSAWYGRCRQSASCLALLCRPQLCVCNQWRCTLGCPKKTLFWPCKLSIQHKVILHVQSTLTNFGDPPLRFGPPPRAPESLVPPTHRVKNQLCRTKLRVCSLESLQRAEQSIVQ